MQRDQIVSQTKEYCTFLKDTIQSVIQSYKTLDFKPGEPITKFNVEIRALAQGKKSNEHLSQRLTRVIINFLFFIFFLFSRFNDNSYQSTRMERMGTRRTI